jgi:nucleoside-diphosphate-sugar epimerase
VTGSTGFIGSHIIPQLIENGYKVYALIRKETSPAKLSLIRKYPVNLVYGDVTNYGSLLNIFRKYKIEIVIHLAGIVRRLKTKASAETYSKVNIQGTENICKACVNAATEKLVFTSTVDVHGPIPRNKTPITEDYPYKFIDIYGKTKAEAEKIALKYNVENGLNIVILRPTHIYGPGYLGYFLNLFNFVKKSPVIPILGNGRTLKHFVHISDVTDAIISAISYGKPGNSYFVADEKPITVNDLFNILCKIQGIKKPLLHIPIPYSIVKLTSKPLSWQLRYVYTWFYTNFAFNLNKAKKELNYNPRISIEEGLKELYRSIAKF